MTVNELMQELVELVRDGRGQWWISIDDDEFEHFWIRDIEGLDVREKDEEIVIL